MTSSDRRYYLTSVANALQVLTILATCEEAGVSEIASKAGLSKSASFRLLYTLRSKGFVHQSKATDKYRLGYRVFAIGMRVKGQDLLGQQLTPFVEELSKQCAETANVGVLEGANVVHVNTVVSRQALRLDVKTGDREPAHSTALGKILLAHQDWDDVRALLMATKLRRLTPHTITALPKLRAELEASRKRGYALDNEETYPGIRCIAVPIHDQRARIIAALSISAPSSRFSDEKVPSHYDLLRSTAKSIRSFLGMNLLEAA